MRSSGCQETSCFLKGQFESAVTNFWPDKPTEAIKQISSRAWKRAQQLLAVGLTWDDSLI